MAKRGSGEGSIYEETPGKWVASVTVGYAIRNGVRRRIRKKFSAATRNAVRDKLTKALRDQQLGVPIAPDKQTVGRFLESWLQNVAKQRVRPSTFGSYEWIVRKHLARSLGKVLLSKLSAQHVQTLIMHLAETAVCPFCVTEIRADDFEAHYTQAHPDAKAVSNPRLSARTIQHIHATLRAALEQARKWELVYRNVATLVEASRVARQQIQQFTPEQARTFLDAMRGNRLEGKRQANHTN